MVRQMVIDRGMSSIYKHFVRNVRCFHLSHGVIDFGKLVYWVYKRENQHQLMKMGSLMMTPSNGNSFRVTGPLWGEPFGRHRWILLTKASDSELWCFFTCAWTNGWANKWDLRRNLRRHIANNKEIQAQKSPVSPNWQWLVCWNPIYVFMPLFSALSCTMCSSLRVLIKFKRALWLGCLGVVWFAKPHSTDNLPFKGWKIETICHPKW